jgi:hypothetical protein
MLTRMDSNGDGSVSVQEYEAAPDLAPGADGPQWRWHDR